MFKLSFGNFFLFLFGILFFVFLGVIVQFEMSDQLFLGFTQRLVECEFGGGLEVEGGDGDMVFSFCFDVFVFQFMR